MRNITLSAAEELIDRARRRAEEEQTTLNQAFREWLASYANRTTLSAKQIRRIAESAPEFQVGTMPDREQRNER